MTPLHVSAEARDITFDFQDSCNCLCFKKPPSPDTRVYVNSQGIVSEFDLRRVSDEQTAIRKSIENLERIVKIMVENKEEEKNQILQTVSEKISNIKNRNNSSLTIEDVREIVREVKEEDSEISWWG